MFSNTTSTSLRSLNEMNARPKRTSYGEMSTWFFMDNNKSEKFDQEYDKSFLDLNEFEKVTCNHHMTEVTLPVIVNKGDKKSKREIAPSPIVREFLMKNWSDKRFDMNKKGIDTQIETRKGRSGAGGAWPHITQAFREDGHRMLFIEGPTYNKVPSNSFENLTSISLTDKPNLTRGLTKALIEKEERERYGVQTRHGTDHGNWSLLR